MKLGYVAHYNTQALEIASRNGFDCVEIFVDQGGSLDVDRLDDNDYKRLAEERSKYGISFASIACSANHLIRDPGTRSTNRDYFKRVIQSCRRLESGIIMTNVWADPALTPSENLCGFREAFEEYVRVAENEGVRIVVENCPHSGFYPQTIGNICYSPEMWEAMFDMVPSKALGLEYDPSHMYWQRIDYLNAITDFGDRIYACHAKDTEIDYKALGRTGIFGRQINRGNPWESGWWRYRIPGWGEIDWKAVFARLYDIGFDGPVFIEHEDPVFAGERFEEGLAMGLRFLKQFVPPC